MFMMGRKTSTQCSSIVESEWKASEDDDLIFVGSCMSTKGIHLAVLDSSALMYTHNGENKLINFSENFVSIPEIANLLGSQSYTIRALEPSPESIETVTSFASKTGDLRRLSDVDVKLIALTYSLESLVCGTKHRTLLGNESWMLASVSHSSIACITTNFATQTVILKMGLRLVAPGPIVQIYEMRRFVLSCTACTIFTADIGRTSCGNCGKGIILRKVAVTVVPQSNEEEDEDTESLYQWHNMPLDLLQIIFNKLYYTDRIRFRTVCKDWYRPIGTRIDNELPWVLCCKFFDPDPHHYSISGISELILLDPIHKKMHKILDFRSIHSELFRNSRLSGTKSGWLILKEQTTDDHIKIFLYNPFTGKLFRLPTLFPGILTGSIYGCCDTILCSSANPASSDCIFVVIREGIVGSDMPVLGISTFRYGDTDWRTKTFDDDGYDIIARRYLCTSKGICYIASSDGRLGSFCVENQEWNWLVESRCWERQQLVMRLVEFNGSLLSVKHCIYFGKCEVHRFEFGEKERGWIEEKSLGNSAVFVDCFGSCVRPAFGDTLAGAILRVPLYKDNYKVTAYSLQEGKSIEKVEAYDWMDPRGHKMFIEPPYS